MPPRDEQDDREDPILMKIVADRAYSTKTTTNGSPRDEGSGQTSGARESGSNSRRPSRRDDISSRGAIDDDLLEVPGPSRRSSSCTVTTSRRGSRPSEASARRDSRARNSQRGGSYRNSSRSRQDDHDLELMKVVASRSQTQLNVQTPHQPQPTPQPRVPANPSVPRSKRSQRAKRELAIVAATQTTKSETPGAFAQAPSASGEDIGANSNTIATTPVVVDPAPLVTATLVGEFEDPEQDPEEPQPQPDTQPSQSDKKKNLMYTILALVCIGLLVVLILMVVLLMVFLLREEDQQGEPFTGEFIPMPDFPQEEKPLQDEPVSAFAGPATASNEPNLAAMANRLFPEDSTLEAIQNDQTSAQARSYQWISEDPQWSSYSDDRFKQRFGLATFFLALANSWKGENLNWLRYDVHECDWQGLTCRDGTNVASMVIVRNKLWGSLPNELFWLTSLRNLDFGINRITGTLPTSVALLTNLEQLKIDVNRLDGSLPSELGLLTQLRFLNLNKNELTGRLPAELGNIPGIKGIDLQHNLLSGSIPSELGKAKALRKLHLTGNSMIIGGIPSVLDFVEEVLL